MTMTKTELFTIDAEIVRLSEGFCDNNTRIDAMQAVFAAECKKAGFDPLDIEAEAEQYRKHQTAMKAVAFVAPAMTFCNNVTFDAAQRRRNEARSA